MAGGGQGRAPRGLLFVNFQRCRGHHVGRELGRPFVKGPSLANTKEDKLFLMPEVLIKCLLPDLFKFIDDF
jgi:hypothetical protein